MKRIILGISLVIATLAASAQCPQARLAFDTTICAATFSKTIDARVLRSRLCGDSLTITFDATGTVLAGAAKMYMHSGPEFTPFSGWQTSYTVGHWGLDDGVGKMDSLGNNHWSITINPRTYYNYPVDSCLNSIFMDFRNANGSVSINNSGNNYNLYTLTGTPSTTFANMTGSYTHNTNVTYAWSDTHTDSVRVFTTGGYYSVTATGVGGCTSTGYVHIHQGITPVSLGADIHRCSNTTPVTLRATAGFSSYQWLTGSAAVYDTFSANIGGCYWVRAVDSVGCVSFDTVKMNNTEVANLSIADSANTCFGDTVKLDASVNIEANGDSLVIIYDATQGVSGLAGASKVYMHSGVQLVPFGAWHYTVGNFGQDDGIGEMDSLGNNKWRIAIDPQCYYGFVPGLSYNGLLMVFRNANGTQTGKAPGSNDIFVNPFTNPPVSTNLPTGITASRKATQSITYVWSNGAHTAKTNITTSGQYIVTASDGFGCSQTDTIQVTLVGSFALNIGSDTTACPGDTAQFSAPAGYAHYHWSTGDTSASIIVRTANNYSVTATDANGCNSIGHRRFSISNRQVTLGSDINKCNNSPVTLYANTGFLSYWWLSNNPTTIDSFTATLPGCYRIMAIDSFGCKSRDTVNVKNSAVLNLSIPTTANSCVGDTIRLDASTNIEANGDSLVIIYDATQGVTGLVGASKVYMHSGVQIAPFGPWNYTVGNFGQDDGIGRMDSLGNNKWRIAIDPQCYYGFTPGLAYNGLLMVFRNATGTATGKSSTNGDIYLNSGAQPPYSTFSGVTAYRKARQPITYTWSNGSNTARTNITTSGTYYVTASDGFGCSKTDSIHVTLANSLTMNIGNDTTICNGQSVAITAAAGFRHYHWSSGDTTQVISVSATGTYTVTATDTTVCITTGTRRVTVAGHRVSLGADVVRCTNTPDTLHASTGFVSYKWFGTGTSSPTYTAVAAGCYWVKATDSISCVSYDTVMVRNAATQFVNAHDTAKGCIGDTAFMDASVQVNKHGDSLVIIYDATQGVSGLAGASKVYMHSGVQLVPFGGWNYTVGNFGQDDGIGKMDSLGNNKWRIAIVPQCYYGFAPGLAYNGLLMVFRNANGTQTGKAAGGTDIFVNPFSTPPASTNLPTGITASYKAVAGVTYNWSNGAATANTYFTTAGTQYVTVTDGSCTKVDTVNVQLNNAPSVYLGRDTGFCSNGSFILNAGGGYTRYIWSTGAGTPTITVTNANHYYVTVFDGNGCKATDSINISRFTAPVVELGNDTVICPTQSLVLNAGTFPSYLWNNAAVTASITVTTVGSYWVQVRDTNGCIGKDTINITASTHCNNPTCKPTAHFRLLTVTLSNQISLRDSSQKAQHYQWSFGDGSTDTTVGSVSHTYASPGHYTVTLVVMDTCGSDTFHLAINVNAVGIQDILGIAGINLYPNPAVNNCVLAMEVANALEMDIELRNLIGEILQVNRVKTTGGKLIHTIDLTGIPSGIYIVEIRTNQGVITRKLNVIK